VTRPEAPAKPAKPDHLRHRERLRRRFLNGGPEALADYELLELILFAAKPRGDTKPLAKALLAEFGDFTGVVAAEPDRLAGVLGLGPAGIAALKAIEAAAVRLTREQVIDRPVLTNWRQLVGYCRASMGAKKTEQFRILFLDRKNVLIADELQQKGTVDHTPVYPREVVKRALELGATALILVHNHPSGDPQPSRADIAMTKEVRDAAKALGILLHDHVIVARGGHHSFKAMGLL